MQCQTCADNMTYNGLRILLTALLIIGLLVLPAGANAAEGITTIQYEALVRESLNSLGQAYEQKDLRAFMNLVSPNFVADDFLMYRAVRRDFRYFDSIRLRLYVDNIAVDSKGRAQVALRYIRNVIAAKDSMTYRDSGLTQVTLHIVDGRAKLLDMKFPLIFGLSEGLQVASGVVRTAETERVIVVDRRGNVSEKPFREALDAANGNSVVTGTKTLVTQTKTQSWSFVDSAVQEGSGIIFDGDVAFFDVFLYFASNVKHKKLSTTFADTTQAPETGYSSASSEMPVIGDVYALQITESGALKYAVFEILDYSFTAGTPHTIRGTIKYKYQPTGSRSFQ